MKRAFTLVEMLAVVGILLTLAAISYPALTQARRSGYRSECISNARQIGVAIALYRSQNDGGESGTPAQMGLPPDTQLGKIVGPLRCHGTTDSDPVPGYHFTWPDAGSNPTAGQFWSEYVGRYGASSVVMFDPNHQPSAGVRSRVWENWTVLGLKLDTSVFWKTQRGYPFTLGWWR